MGKIDMGKIDLLKDLAKILQDINRIDLLRQLSDMQTELLELTQERNALLKKNEEFKNERQTQQQLGFDRNLYWMIDKDGSKKGPYCATCWDSEKQLVRLIDYNHPEFLRCNVCKNSFKTTSRPVG